jgi:antitoxin (DNA-binding transcriptional repressor) of toxin-antitoxin stability system
MKVGTKELKNRLSHYLRLVREGEHVQVTDHGTVVAEIRAARVAVSSDEACLQALEQEGIAMKGKKRLTDIVPVPGRSKKRLSEIVIEDRD